MQNPEEDILKRFLQDTFSDYEPEPSEQTWENIYTAIQPDKPRWDGGMKRFLIPVVALLLLLSGVIIWEKKSTEKVENELVKNTKVTPFNSPVVGQRIEKYIEKNKSTENKNQIYSTKTLIVNSVTPYFEEDEILPIVQQQSEVLVIGEQVLEKTIVSTEKINTQPLLVSLDEKNALIVGENNEIQNVAIEHKDVERENISPINHVKTKKTQIKIGRVLKEKNVSNVYNEEIKLGEESAKNISENQIATNEATIEEVRYTKPLELLKNKDIVFVKSDLITPQISENPLSKEIKPIRRAIYLSVSITPLQTYRILTVNNRAIQNLQKNGLFDAERNGYAFEIGVTKPIGNTWNFRTNISYLKMRQWADYQVSTDELLVENIAANTNNRIEQVVQHRTESNTLEMIGLKADVQKFLRISGRNRYFIATGTQLMYDPANRQTNVFLNASAGFQHIINKNCFLTVEPTANYLLNNINNSKSLIQSNAYNLGLKIGLNFKVQ
ncbi:hypothetical protein VB796_14115 [Arcicella sp. LKC2W]|uniref:hypothetical protein n=1 Tax=Arcicella sp. LKC2W TaxID=2984198 RepID=UPI002B21A2AC|nr:hypothetical protein [Arcicella sp. LKC2W]MEA5460188.1 hypothetical protein [Arcicella sp. LKC2W]